MPATRLTRPVAALSLSALALLGVSACSDDGDDASPTTTEAAATTEAPSTIEASEDDTTTTEAEDGDSTTTTEGDDGGGEAASGEVAAWAEPFETPGDLLTTIEGEGFKVDIYQVGTTTSPKDGSFVDPDTNEPTLPKGAEIVFMNYVFTNTGDETIPLSFSLAEVNAKYADWPYLGGMDSITDRDLWAEMGVLSTTITPNGSEAPFMWEPGTSFAKGDNFLYQAGGPITFEARMTPADDEGELVSEERQEIEVETKIV